MGMAAVLKAAAALAAATVAPCLCTRSFDKTSTTNRTELVRHALKIGLLSDQGMEATRLRAEAARNRVLRPQA